MCVGHPYEELGNAERRQLAAAHFYKLLGAPIIQIASLTQIVTSDGQAAAEVMHDLVNE